MTLASKVYVCTLRLMQPTTTPIIKSDHHYSLSWSDAEGNAAPQTQTHIHLLLQWIGTLNDRRAIRVRIPSSTERHIQRRLQAMGCAVTLKVAI